MTKPSAFLKILLRNNIKFFVGVPDSLLKNFTDFISQNLNPKNNIIATSEGGAVAIAAGYNMAKKEMPLVYLQNSGLGNLVNPLLSLTDKNVYQIPMIIMIGWRGEPNKHDEPQHLTQGKVTINLIKSMNKRVFILDGNEKKDILKLKKVINISNKRKEPTFLLVKKMHSKKLQKKERKKIKRTIY